MGVKDIQLANKQRLLEALRPKLTQAVPGNCNATQLMRVFYSAITRTPRLKQCTDISLANALMTAAELGLAVNTALGQAYIIPYGQEATFQLGYKGLRDLVYRTGQIDFIDAKPVHKKDTFNISLGSDPLISHTPCLAGDRGEVVGYYAVMRMKGSTTSVFEYMSHEEAMAHGKKYSKSFSKADSAWQTAPESMCLKTVLLKLLKLAPVSADNYLVARAVEMDQDSVFYDMTAKVMSEKEIEDIKGLEIASESPHETPKPQKELAAPPPRAPENAQNEEDSGVPPDEFTELPPDKDVIALKAEISKVVGGKKLVYYAESRGIPWDQVGALAVKDGEVTEDSVKSAHARLYKEYGKNNKKS